MSRPSYFVIFYAYLPLHRTVRCLYLFGLSAALDFARATGCIIPYPAFPFHGHVYRFGRTYLYAFRKEQQAMAQQQAHGCTVFLAQTSIRGTGFHLPPSGFFVARRSRENKILPAVLQCHFDTCRIVRPLRTKSTRLTELPSDDTDGSNTDTNGRVQASPVWRATYVRVGCPFIL